MQLYANVVRKNGTPPIHESRYPDYSVCRIIRVRAVQEVVDAPGDHSYVGNALFI